MVTIRKKVFFITVFECWNGIEKGFVNLFQIAIYKNVNINEKVSCLLIRSKDIRTELVIDLTQDEKTIFSNFTKQIRNSIQQAKRMGVICHFTDDKDTFEIFFNSFAKKKRIKSVNNLFLNKLGKNLYVSFAKYNGTLYAAHCYIVDFEASSVLLYRSASLRLIDTNIEPNRIGKANKMLHYQDMLFFKSRGFKYYAFGGYSGVNKSDFDYGINKFKSHFGGGIAYYYYYYTLAYYLIQFFTGKFKKYILLHY